MFYCHDPAGAKQQLRTAKKKQDIFLRPNYATLTSHSQQQQQQYPVIVSDIVFSTFAQTECFNFKR